MNVNIMRISSIDGRQYVSETLQKKFHYEISKKEIETQVLTGGRH